MSSDPLRPAGPLEMIGDGAPTCVDGVCELPAAEDAPLDD
jgi:hypothetical protein